MRSFGLPLGPLCFAEDDDISLRNASDVHLITNQVLGLDMLPAGPPSRNASAASGLPAFQPRLDVRPARLTTKPGRPVTSPSACAHPFRARHQVRVGASGSKVDPRSSPIAWVARSPPVFP